MSEHTPGPWKVEDGGFVGGPVGFGQVCQLWNKHEEDYQNAEANARLIAAAPDLCEALKKLANEAAGFLALSDVERHGMTNSRVLRDRIEQARDVIRKAEAES